MVAHATLPTSQNTSEHRPGFSAWTLQCEAEPGNCNAGRWRDSLVAIKVVPHAELEERIEREVLLAKNLTHPNITQT